MSETPVTPEPQDPPKDNSVIQHMRTQIDAANTKAREQEARAAELQTRLDAIEREKMSEADRLRAEADDAKRAADAHSQELERLRDENGRYTSRLETLYTEELQSVPEDKRSQVEALSKSGTWDERLEALRAAKALLPPATFTVPRVQPGTPGAVVDPPVVPPTKTNAEIAKAGGLRGLGDAGLASVTYRREVNKPQGD